MTIYVNLLSIWAISEMRSMAYPSNAAFPDSVSADWLTML